MYTLASLLGNEALVKNLKRAAVSKKAPHAMLFFGAAGLGKKHASFAFAKTLFCAGGGEVPCGACVSCKTFESGNHPDFFVVRAHKTKAIGISDVREQIVQNMETKPYHYPFKIFIIDHAETMTAQAQNALLKTIEEPSSYGLFMLLSENDAALLPTILSRCAVLRLAPVSEGQLADYLAGRLGLGRDEALAVAARSGGNVGQAILLAGDEAALALRGEAISLLRRLQQAPPSEAFAAVKELESRKDRAQDILDSWLFWLKDAAALSQGAFAQHRHADLLPELKAYAAAERPEAHIRKCGAVINARRRLSQNANAQLVWLDLLRTLVTKDS